MEILSCGQIERDRLRVEVQGVGQCDKTNIIDETAKY